VPKEFSDILEIGYPCLDEVKVLLCVVGISNVMDIVTNTLSTLVDSGRWCMAFQITWARTPLNCITMPEGTSGGRTTTNDVHQPKFEPMEKGSKMPADVTIPVPLNLQPLFIYDGQFFEALRSRVLRRVKAAIPRALLHPSPPSRADKTMSEKT
jgi:hypothetical protein